MDNMSNRLRDLRTKKNLSIREVAVQLKVSHTTYRSWEYGTQIRGEPYVQLAQLFNVSVNELLTGKPIAIEEHLKNIEVSIQAIRSRL